MLPTWVLEQMGISDPQIGMEIVLSYQIGDSYDYVTDTFLLSGYYTDYIPMRTNNRGYVYVSSAFKDSLNVSLDNSVTAMIRFQGNDNADKNCERLRREIDFTEGQTFEIVPLEQANGGTIILAVIILAVFISFSGYLLIYNILSLSFCSSYYMDVFPPHSGHTPRNSRSYPLTAKPWVSPSSFSSCGGCRSSTSKTRPQRRHPA